MIPLQNLHTHTVFDDGKNTPLEMAAAAEQAGLTSLGFSVHSTVPYENDWTVRDISGYLKAIRDTKEIFRGKLEIYNGIEWDLISNQDVNPFDYVIGSIHHITLGSRYPSIDDTAEIADEILISDFGSNRDAMANAYYAQYEKLAACDFVDIIGHFDLLNKFSRFDENSRFYQDCAMAALDTLVAKDKIFEVNTGAMSRGYRSIPYPNPWFLKVLKERNARVLISSDAHSINAVSYAFSDTADLLRSIGFSKIWYYSPAGFYPVSL